MEKNYMKEIKLILKGRFYDGTRYMSLGEVLCVIYRKTPLRKTLISNWKTRNDSSEVNAILHPELDLDNPRTLIHDIPINKPLKKTKGVYRRCCLSSNTCYCREESIKPKIFSKPGKCLALENIGRRIGDENFSRTSAQCFCKVDSTVIPDSEVIKKTNEAVESEITLLQLTEQRKNYEVYREDQEKEYMRELAEYQSEQRDFLEDIEEYENYDHDGEQLIKPYSARNDSHLARNDSHSARNDSHSARNDSHSARNSHLARNDSHSARNDSHSARNDSHPARNDSHSLSTVLGTKVVDSLIGSSGFVTEGLDVNDIKKFRDDHYFETHDLGDIPHHEIPEHTCIHQFKLDERLLPRAINADIYGRSRCLICSKPMEEDRVQISKSYFSDTTTNRSLRNFSKCYQLGLFPRIINIGGETSKIVLKLSDNQMKFDSLASKCRRPQYTNTFALRQQKMTC